MSDGEEAQPPEAEQDQGAWFLFFSCGNPPHPASRSILGQLDKQDARFFCSSSSSISTALGGCKMSFFPLIFVFYGILFLDLKNKKDFPIRTSVNM